MVRTSDRDMSEASRGVVTLKYQNQVTEAMVQNARRHLLFWVGLSAELRQPFLATRVWVEIFTIPEQLHPSVLRQFVDACGPKTFGRAQH